MADTTASRRRVRIRFVPNKTSEAGESDPLILAAEDPEPTWILQTSDGGQSLGNFELWHPLDLVWPDTFKVLAIERETADLPSGPYLERVREQVQLLIPDMPEEIFTRLTAQQILAIGTKAWQRVRENRQEARDREADAGNPPDGGRASASSSRSPVASTDGAMRS